MTGERPVDDREVVPTVGDEAVGGQAGEPRAGHPSGRDHDTPAMSGTFDRRMLDAVVAVADGLELEPTLRRIVRAASDLTGARYAAVGVLGEDGLHKSFVFTGMDPDVVREIGHPPRGVGVLGHITRVGRAVRVTEVAEHHAAAGMPPGHPPMHSFLGVPVGIGERVVGNLYLAEKDGGFTADDEDVVVALAAAAAVAVENARLYELADRRRRWVAAAQQVSTAMLSGADEEDALRMIAERAAAIAGAATAVLILPGLDGDWVLEIAVGEDVDDMVGTVMPADGRAAAVIEAGIGVRVADLATDPRVKVKNLRRFGPALYAPLVADGERLGVLMVARRIGEEQFSRADLDTAQIFASQAALALQLADARRRAEEAELLEDRARIARDLHDLVVQELFAMGIRLSRLRDRLDPDELADVDSSLDSLDRVVRQIRSTIRALRDPEDRAGLVDRVYAEAARSRSFIGFKPVVHVDVSDGLDLDGAVPAEVADDIVAVVREGLSNVARHAHAGAVVVALEASPQRVLVEVRDDGVGLSPQVSRRSGLDNLGERARRHGGSAVTEPGATGGTTLRWQVPLDTPAVSSTLPSCPPQA